MKKIVPKRNRKKISTQMKGQMLATARAIFAGFVMTEERRRS